MAGSLFKGSCMVTWKKNFIVVWFSQFLSIMGFAFAMPFAPFFMQELGVTEPAKLKMWVALFAAAAPVTLAILAPFWGLLADRYGRRIMLLRANFAAAIVVALMGTVHSAAALVGLRLFQGVFTGTVAAAQTMVSVQAPPHRQQLHLRPGRDQLLAAVQRHLAHTRGGRHGGRHPGAAI